MTDIEKLLIERSATHGDYVVFAEVAQKLKVIARFAPMWPHLTQPQRESIEMILHKVARILTGNPMHKDHWDDIQGYAKLSGDRVKPQ